MRTLETALADFTSTYYAVQLEREERRKVLESPEYLELQIQIEKLTKKQEAMFAHIPDSTEEYEADREELMRLMQENNLTEAGEFKAKTRAVRRVDVRAVLEAMGGDIDSLMLVSSIKQKDLEDFIQANKEYKKDLRACIVDEGYRITDLLPLEL